MLIQKAEQHILLPTTGHNTQVPGQSIITIAKQTSATIHLVECIIRENNCLSQQIKHMECEVMKARPLSFNLLKQNENMRKLYHQRTQDIKKLIQTISINNDENKTDYEHQCFLFKQLNCSTLKNIKSLDKQRGMINQRLNELQRSFQEISQQKNQLQNQSLTKLKVRLGKGRNSESARSLQRQYETEQNKLMQTYKEVNQLIIKNNTIKREIASLKNNNETPRQSLAGEIQQFQDRLNEANKSIANYQQELKNDQIDLDRASNYRNQKQERANQTKKAMLSQVRKYEKLQSQWTRNNEERERFKQKINLSVKNKLKSQAKLEAVKDQRQELQQKIKETKLRIQRTFLEQNQKEQFADKQRVEKVKKFKASISTSLNDSKNQSKKLLCQMKKAQKSIQALTQDLSALEDEVEEYKKTISGYPNPIAQIERIQLIFRLKRMR